MKYLALLFSFYLIALTLMPCGDVSDNAVDAKTSYTIHKDTRAMENCNQEVCTPFCSCSCCSVGKNFPVQTVSISVDPVVLVSYCFYAASAPSEQAVDVWQPPKLS